MLECPCARPAAGFLAGAMATSQPQAESTGNAESSSHEHVMASAVTLPLETETSTKRGKRRFFFFFCDEDLEKACLEQEIDDLTAESRKMRLIDQNQQGTIAVLKTRNQSLENELALARRRIVSLENNWQLDVSRQARARRRSSRMYPDRAWKTCLVQRGSRM